MIPFLNNQYFIYTREDYRGTWEYTPGKGETSSKPSFSGSMLILAGVMESIRPGFFLWLTCVRYQSKLSEDKTPWTRSGS